MSAGAPSFFSPSASATPATTTADAKPATQAVRCAAGDGALSACDGGARNARRSTRHAQRPHREPTPLPRATRRKSGARPLEHPAQPSSRSRRQPRLRSGRRRGRGQRRRVPKKMEQEVPLNPVTPEIVQAVFMGNQQHFKGQTLEQVQDVISQQLAQEFKANQAQEIQDRLLERFPFTPTLAPPKLPRMDVDRASAPSLGSKDAKVSVVIFSISSAPTVVASSDQRGTCGALWRTGPLGVPTLPARLPQIAAEIAVASACAHDQGKFWGFHDRIFAQRTNFELRRAQRARQGRRRRRPEGLRALPRRPQEETGDRRGHSGRRARSRRGDAALFINGQPLYNLVNAGALQALINVELQAQGIKPPPPLKPALIRQLPDDALRQNL